MTSPSRPVRRRAGGQLEAETLAVPHRAGGEVAGLLCGPLAYTTAGGRCTARTPHASAYAPVAAPRTRDPLSFADEVPLRPLPGPDTGHPR